VGTCREITPLRRLALAALPVLLLTACYRVAGVPSEGLRSVGVEVFTNKSLYRDVDFQLTDHLRREISAETIYTIESPKTADAVIMGELHDYREDPIVIDENDAVRSWRLVASARYELVDNRTGDVLVGPETVQWSEVYRARSDRPLADVRDEAIRKLARRIVQRVFMPWSDSNAPREKQQE